MCFQVENHVRAKTARVAPRVLRSFPGDQKQATVARIQFVALKAEIEDGPSIRQDFKGLHQFAGLSDGGAHDEVLLVSKRINLVFVGVVEVELRPSAVVEIGASAQNQVRVVKLHGRRHHLFSKRFRKSALGFGHFEPRHFPEEGSGGHPPGIKGTFVVKFTQASVDSPVHFHLRFKQVARRQLHDGRNRIFGEVRNFYVGFSFDAEVEGLGTEQESIVNQRF